VQFLANTDFLTVMRVAVTLFVALCCWTLGWAMVTRYIGAMVASNVRRFIVVAAINVAETWAAYTMAIVIGIFAVYGKALDLWFVALAVAGVQLVTIVIDRIAGVRMFAVWANLATPKRRPPQGHRREGSGRHWWVLWIFIPALATMLFLIAMK
jgi:hypothetical protein